MGSQVGTLGTCGALITVVCGSACSASVSASSGIWSEARRTALGGAEFASSIDSVGEVGLQACG